MPRTTDQWEALLDGTTPGPWREDSDDGILGRRKGEVENWELDPVVGHMHRDSDNTLASSAPEAVAEVVRLLQAITQLRNFYASPADPGDDYGRGAEAAYQIVAADLTRLLNGEA